MDDDTVKVLVVVHENARLHRYWRLNLPPEMAEEVLGGMLTSDQLWERLEPVVSGLLVSDAKVTPLHDPSRMDRAVEVTEVE